MIVYVRAIIKCAYVIVCFLLGFVITLHFAVDNHKPFGIGVYVSISGVRHVAMTIACSIIYMCMYMYA